MIRGENSDSIPINLLMEILSRLPAKSTARFRCVSKVWGSMLLSPYFTGLFLTRSSARPPRLLFVVNPFDEDWRLLSSPLPDNPYEKSSLLVATDFHTKFPKQGLLSVCGHASGFIYFRRHTWISEEDNRTVHMICNPTTGQLASLPSPKGRPLLGFDPVDKQYKVLSISAPNQYHEKEEPVQILTLGTGNDSWRNIHCPLKHFPWGDGICINGVLYYFPAGQCYYIDIEKIVCFDVRSEKFKFIDFITYQVGGTYKLINYKGKLGVITMLQFYSPKSSIEVCMWVIKDAEKPESEWSTYSYDSVVDNCFRYPHLTVVGVTATDDIVLSRSCWDKDEPFCIYYLSPGRNTLHSVEIKGFGANHFEDRIRGHNPGVKVFVDHVEDLRFLMMKSSTDAATSKIPPAQKRYPKRRSTTTSA